MAVKRIVTNIPSENTGPVAAFYKEFFGLEPLMDMGWIITLGSPSTTAVQISIATQGGSGTQVPDISIEVDDISEVLARVRAAGIEIVYGPVDEPWGVRRFYMRDPAGMLVNVLTHGDNES